ncbi:hypothetical protein BN1356_01324 [Streptococcus varani]|uniref:Uncharacterized protein n=1 Tax=Streptococcus varani TaxID=1608583 RepID=A0A0E4CSS9_9STRE|nr:hypothetical protein [Streptococcus varani]CQR24980.1 hypothetical protein BN1356_01324 [Streptococcus varani]
MDIIEILELFKSKIEARNPIDKKYLVSKGNQNGFEILVPEIAEEIKQEINDISIFDYKVHLGHHFPDMNLIINEKRFGLELKSRNNGKWDTNGNSVFESISDEEYEDIYLLFGSKVPNHDQILIRYDNYWKVTSAITVTHSPRFKINMDATSSVFPSAEDYNMLREKSDTEKVKFLQDYLKENTSGVKWFISPDDASKSVKPTSLNTLSHDIQNLIKAEVLILFPQDLISASKANYTRAHEFIITNHFYYSSSFRDFFSAGGKWTKENVDFPKSIETFYSLRRTILCMLEEASEDFQFIAYESWKTLGKNVHLSKDSFVDDYKAVIDSIGRVNFYNELQELELDNLSSLLFEPEDIIP